MQGGKLYSQNIKRNPRTVCGQARERTENNGQRNGIHGSQSLYGKQGFRRGITCVSRKTSL